MTRVDTEKYARLLEDRDEQLFDMFAPSCRVTLIMKDTIMCHGKTDPGKPQPKSKTWSSAKEFFLSGAFKQKDLKASVVYAHDHDDDKCTMVLLLTASDKLQYYKDVMTVDVASGLITALEVSTIVCHNSVF